MLDKDSRKMQIPNKQDYDISLNFLPLRDQDFRFEVFRKLYRTDDEGTYVDECRVLSLPIDPELNPDIDNNRKNYWISFTSLAGFESYFAHCKDNRYLTEWFLFESLKTKSAQQLGEDRFYATDKFRKRISYTIQTHQGLGQETVWVEPFFMSTERCFGFLIDFHFRKFPSVDFGRRVQQLSLSLDSRGRRNRNFNINKNEKIQSFLKQVASQIFPLEFDNSSSIDIDLLYLSLHAKSLEVKKYIFGNNNTDISQFRGVRANGPYKMPTAESIYYLFVFLEKHRGYARDLLIALQGKNYSGSFSGYEQMFRLKFDNDNVVGMSIQEYDKPNLELVLEEVKSIGCDFVMPVFVIPSKSDPDNERIYYTIKHIFVDEFIPVQVVTLDLLQKKETLKWSVANIALQIFSKIGGYPWKVQPSRTECLIIGIGTRHDVREVEDTQIVDKYFAYSVLTDSSGLYLDIEVLSETTEERNYIAELRESIRNIVDKYQSTYNRIVVHTPFKIKKEELEAIQSILDDYHTDENEFVVLKINMDNKFFGYNMQVSSLVPYESSYVRLSWKEYLVWFEGLQYHNPNALTPYSGPSHIEFYYETRDLSDEERIGYLQDTINLSGANWRGFNAKSLPVSIFYCRIVADFIMHFKKMGYEEFNIKNFTPWFL